VPQAHRRKTAANDVRRRDPPAGHLPTAPAEAVLLPVSLRAAYSSPSRRPGRRSADCHASVDERLDRLRSVAMQRHPLLRLDEVKLPPRQLNANRAHLGTKTMVAVEPSTARVGARGIEDEVVAHRTTNTAAAENDFIHRLCVRLLKKGVALFHVKPSRLGNAFSTPVSTGRASVLRRVSRETRSPVDNFCG
jgi:hypothetical protein